MEGTGPNEKESWYINVFQTTGTGGSYTCFLTFLNSPGPSYVYSYDLYWNLQEVGGVQLRNKDVHFLYVSLGVRWSHGPSNLT